MNEQRLLYALKLEDATQEDTEHLALLLGDCVEMMAAVTKLHSDLQLELAARMEADTVTIPGVGFLARTQEPTSRWKDADSAETLRHDLREAIAQRLSANIRTGEVDLMTRNIVREALDAAFEIIPSFSNIKAPGRKLGLDIGDYREFGTRYRVALVPEGVSADD